MKKYSEMTVDQLHKESYNLAMEACCISQLWRTQEEKDIIKDKHDLVVKLIEKRSKEQGELKWH